MKLIRNMIFLILVIVAMAATSCVGRGDEKVDNVELDTVYGAKEKMEEDKHFNFRID